MHVWKLRNNEFVVTSHMAPLRELGRSWEADVISRVGFVVQVPSQVL